VNENLTTELLISFWVSCCY